MSRRSARGADKLTKTEAAEKVAAVATPRRGRGVKVEEKEVLEVVTPAKSANKIDSEDEEEVEETELLAIVTPEKSNKTSKKKIKAEKGKEEEEEEEEAKPTIQSKEPSKRKAKSAKATVKEVVEKAIVGPKESLKQKVNTVKSIVGVAKLKVEKEVKEEAISKTTSKGKRKAKTEEAEEDGEGLEDNKARKKRKTKEEKEAEAMPLATRTLIGSLKKAMHIGAHVSGAGGVHNAIHNSIHIGGNSFALFLKSQRKWTSPPLAPEARDQFKAFCLEHKYDPAKVILPHGSYLVNLAQADAEKAEQAYSCFLDDLQRCEQLGIRLYNFHPGSTGGNPRPEAIARIAAQLNKAHKATKTVVTVLENMAGAGNVIGCTWEDLRDIIALIDDKTRVGVCIDTCHTFAAGYDLRTPEAFKKVMDDFSSIVGMKYLMALHLNDSKAPMASNRDLHANIGTGFLGLRAFHNVMNFSPFQGLPMVLETPIDKKGPDGKAIEDKGVWATEIKLLEGLIGADTDSEDFKKEELRLQDLGADERKKFQGQVDKKKQQSIDSMFKKGKTKKAKKSDDPEDSDASEGGCSH